jgi:hypothetical protein
MRQAGFDVDKTQLDDEVVWDDEEEDDDAGSSAAAEGSSATYGNDGSEELEDLSEPLSHSSKSPCSSSLRDWSEDDDDDELGPAAALGATTLNVATAAAAGAKVVPIVDQQDSPEQPPAAPKPATSKPAAPEGAGSGSASTKKRSQTALPEPAQKRKKVEPAVKSLLPRKAKKVVKCLPPRWLGKSSASVLLSAYSSRIPDWLTHGVLSS